MPARVVRGLRGAVASPHYLASEAGLGVLRAGGSAVDAAIATNAALSVVTSYMCGLGGDAFWLIWDGERTHALNGSGRAAGAASPEALRAAGHTEMPQRGPWTVNVPGAVHSWGEAHARYGRLRWADVLAPAIELADGGFAATDGWVAAVETTAGVFGTDGDWARTFRPHGRPWRAGERVTLRALGGTLRRLAAEGPQDYYTGSLAKRAAEYLESQGSPLRADDFAGHQSDWGAPLSMAYRGLTSLSHPPNSSGVTALELLGLLDRLDPGADDARWVDLCLRAAEIALADRDAALTDPLAMPAGAVERLLDPARLDALAAAIERGDGRPASVPVAGGDTIYLATADAGGQVVSLIESNYRGFGSGLVDPQTGVSYQNRGAQFSLDPGHVNAIAPGKRTAHTLTPGMLLRDGRPWIAHGSMGGAIQPQVFAQFISAVVDRGQDIATALARPRWSIGAAYAGGPAGVALESRFASEIVAELERAAHSVTLLEPFSSAMGHAHAVQLDGDGFAAASDPRSEGAALAW